MKNVDKEYVKKQLDRADSMSSEELDTLLRGLAQNGAPIILPLSQIWAEGQVRATEFKDDRRGLIGLADGLVCAVFAILLVSNGWVIQTYLAGIILLVIKICQFIVGRQWGRTTAKLVQQARNQAHWAAKVLSLIDDPACTPRMLEACFGLNGRDQDHLILVKPIAEQLNAILYRSDPSEFTEPSRLMKVSIGQLLVQDRGLDPNPRLVEQLVGLVGEAGLVEFVAEVDRLTVTRTTPRIREAAESCSRILHEIIDKRQRASTHLRPTSSPDDMQDTLLRPAQASVDERYEVLLRSVQDDQ